MQHLTLALSKDTIFLAINIFTHIRDTCDITITFELHTVRVYGSDMCHCGALGLK